MMDFLVAMGLISGCQAVFLASPFQASAAISPFQLQDDGVQIIENAEGKRTTPSFVAFTEAGTNISGINDQISSSKVIQNHENHG